MSVYVVAYDLKKPGRDYDDLYDAIKKYAYCHMQKSVWLVDTALSAAALRDILKKPLDSNDMIFVGELQKHWASSNNPCADWLKSSNRRWG